MLNGRTVARTAHFSLHRLTLGSDDTGKTGLFVPADVWLGAMVPKRWARRAVTRNAIKRQIYAVSQARQANFPHAAHVVRLRLGFDRTQFVSASSELLKKTVCAELHALFSQAASVS